MMSYFKDSYIPRLEPYTKVYGEWLKSHSTQIDNIIDCKVEQINYIPINLTSWEDSLNFTKIIYEVCLLYNIGVINDVYNTLIDECHETGNDGLIKYVVNDKIDYSKVYDSLRKLEGTLIHWLGDGFHVLTIN